MDGVGRTGGGAKWHLGQNASAAIHFFLDDQMCSIDVRLIPVIPIRPTQHITKITAAKRAERATCQHLGISSSRTQHRAIRVASSIGDESSVTGDGEDALAIGIAPPGLPIRRATPQGLIGALERIGSQGRTGRRRGRGCAC